jgi:hypothetical protein
LCWDIRIKACLDPTEVDPNCHDPTKKSIAANGIYKNRKFRAARKRGKIIGKTGANIVVETVLKFG